MWDALRLRFVFTLLLLEMVANMPYAVWFWALRRLGRHQQAEAQLERLVGEWSRQILRRFNVEVRVEGLEHLPRTGPVVIMANHQSLFDIPVCLGYLGRMMGFVAKRELFRIPGLGYWMRQIHCPAINRADIAGSGKLLAALSRDIKQRGYCLLIFPEGTRSRDAHGEIGAFKRGSLRLAQAEEIPIVPVSLDGTRFLVNPQLMAATRRGGRVVRVRVAPARLAPRNLSAPENKRLMQELRDTIVSNHEAIRVHWITN